ncbi:MAG: ribonuclease H family protein [Shewanella sp.]
MAKKFYVVWVGRETGIFTTWDKAKRQVDKFPKAKYKSFKTKAEADAAFSTGISSVYSAKSSSLSQNHQASTTKTSNSNADYNVVIYTDGGCEPNPGKAGSGIAVYRDNILSELWYGLYNRNGTNNSAELNALHQALLIAKKSLASGKSVFIRSDSQYSINSITNWAYAWKAKGWKRKAAGDIKNLDIIKASHTLYDELKEKLVISHVAAHIGIEGNELADRMSIYAIDKKDAEFCRYPEPIELAGILSLRAG